MSNSEMKLGPGYFRLISHFERGPANDPKCRLTVSGAALDAYLCPAGVATIGAGSIKRLDGSDVEMGDSITEAEVFALAERDAEDAADAVRKIQRPLTQNQFEAYTAFTHNLGEGNFRKIAPLIEEGRWEDVAEKMGEYVRAWGKHEGRWYYMALLGLKIRRTAEGLHSLGLPWQEVCDPDNIGMPKRREWQPEGTARDGTKGRYFDVLLPGATEFTAIEAMASALRKPELTLTQKAEPAPSVAPASAGQPELAPQPKAPAAPASKPAAPVSGPAAGPVAAPSAPQVPQKPLPVPAPAKPPAPVGTKPVHPQTKMPDGVPYGVDPTVGAKPMETTERFIGAAMLWLANGLRVGMANGMKLSGGVGFLAVLFLDMMKSPVTAAVMLSSLVALVCFVGWLFGIVIEKAGLRKKRHGERTATQLMY